MQLEFFGGAGEVTGSCHILTVGGRRLLLDCGMIQGGAAHGRAQPRAVSLRCGAGRRRHPEPRAHRPLRPPAAAAQARLPRARSTPTRPAATSCASCSPTRATMQQRDAERENRKRRESTGSGDRRAALHAGRRARRAAAGAHACATGNRSRCCRASSSPSAMPATSSARRASGWPAGRRRSSAAWLSAATSASTIRRSCATPSPVRGADLVLMESTYGAACTAIAPATLAEFGRDPARREARWRQRADSRVRGRPQPGDPLRARHALRRVAARRLAGVPRQPDGDRGHRRCTGSTRSCSTRRRGSGTRANAALPPLPNLTLCRTADESHGDQPHRERCDRHRRQRHVHRRAHRAPPEAQPVAAGVRRGVHRLPGRGHARPRAGRRPRPRAHPRRAGQGRGPRAHAGRLLRARRPARPAALVCCHPGPAAGVAGARRARGCGGTA